MPGEADWRDPGNYDPDEALDWPAIAMGYLARNARYQADYAAALNRVEVGIDDIAHATKALIDRWGISLPVDPAREADHRDVIVPPDLSPTTLMVIAAPNLCDPIDALRIPGFDDADFAMRLGDRDYFVLRGANGDHRLWSAQTACVGCALFLPLQTDASIRLAAAGRLCRRLAGLSEGPSPLLPTRLKLERHHRLFRLLDGRRGGARARLLATVLIDPRVEGFCAAEWADCRQRKQIGRWTKEANALAEGGYLALLRGG